MTDPILAWHFVSGPLPGVLRDGCPVPADGEWLEHKGEIVPCESGLHASVRAIDALRYAPGQIVCRVELDGEIVKHDSDKIVGRRRRVLWRADAGDVLRAFACDRAMSVASLWGMPDVVRQYLTTCDPSLRDAAWGVASAAARAASAAAKAAAWAAAWAASDVSWGAASAAAWGVASAAASAAAMAAAWDAANTDLTARLEALKP